MILYVNNGAIPDWDCGYEQLISDREMCPDLYYCYCRMGNRFVVNL